MIVLALLAGALYLVAVNTQVPFLYAVAAIPLAVALVSALDPAWSLAHVEARVDAPRETMQGDCAQVTLTISNRSRRAAAFLEVEFAPPPWDRQGAAVLMALPVLPPLGTRQVVIPVPCPVRGSWSLSPAVIASSGRMGLFRRRRPLPGGGETLVLPVGPRLRRLSLQKDGGRRRGDLRARRAGGSGDLHNIRAYSPGDDPRCIHWPALARSGQMLVREREADREGGLAIVLDAAAEGDPEALESLVSAAAALLDLSLREARPTRLVWREDGSVRHCDAHRVALEALARLTPDASSGDLADAVPAGRAVILLSTRPATAPRSPSWRVIRFVGRFAGGPMDPSSVSRVGDDLRAALER